MVYILMYYPFHNENQCIRVTRCALLIHYSPNGHINHKNPNYIFEFLFQRIHHAQLNKKYIS